MKHNKNIFAKLPGIIEVEELWEQYGMLPNIKRHSRQVCQVALTVWQWLNEADFYLDRPTIETGALLHDIAKAYCLNKPGLPHNLEGQRILEQRGYPELGLLVAKHVNLGRSHPLDEAAIVFYADKRVVGDKVVSVAERYDYILKVYGQGKPERINYIKKDEQTTYEVERNIFKIVSASYRPQDIIGGHTGSFYDVSQS